MKIWKKNEQYSKIFQTSSPSFKIEYWVKSKKKFIYKKYNHKMRFVIWKLQINFFAIKKKKESATQ